MSLTEMPIGTTFWAIETDVGLTVAAKFHDGLFYVVGWDVWINERDLTFVKIIEPPEGYTINDLLYSE